MGMVVRFGLVAAAIATTLVFVQQRQVLQNAGLFGSCTEIATPVGESGVWHECVSGKLTGVPGLSRGSCEQIQETPNREIWRCPTALESNKTRQ